MEANVSKKEEDVCALQEEINTLLNSPIHVRNHVVTHSHMYTMLGEWVGVISQGLELSPVHQATMLREWVGCDIAGPRALSTTHGHHATMLREWAGCDIIGPRALYTHHAESGWGVIHTHTHHAERVGGHRAQSGH